jgi:hypothetical protein
MKLVSIEFRTKSNVVLTEGLIQMLDQQVSNNVFIFEVEEEEIEMLIEECQDEIEFPIVEVIVIDEEE